MQLTLFKALKTLNLDDDTASEVVEAFEGHIAMKIKEANAGLLAATAGLEARINALTWLIGTVGTLLSIIGLAIVFTGLAPAYLKLFGH